jgi:hypothetical protein
MQRCECGCGGEIVPQRHHRWRGSPKYLRGHNRNKAPNPKRWSMKSGYKVLLIDGRYVFEHRRIVEERIGRPLTRNEFVHHRDHNRLNNDPANLELITPSDHARHHHHPGEDARSHVHKHFDCECGRSTGLSEEWRERNRKQRASVVRGPDGKFTRA